MKFTLIPKTGPGKFASLISILFIIMIVLKTSVGFPFPTFGIFGIGILGFILSCIAIFKKDRTMGVFFSLLVGLGIVAVFIAVGISGLGLFKDFPVKDKLTTEEAGKPLDYSINLGRISENNNFIYYTLDGKLYQRQYDWTEPVMISENPVGAFKIIGDWIYYLDSEDGGNLYKMRTNGSDSRLISDDHVGEFAVTGGSIFYSTILSIEEINAIKDEIKQGKGSDKINESMESINDLYRIGTDGTGKVKLVSDGAAPMVIDEWVYYRNASGNLLRMKTDGTNQSKIAEKAMSLHYNGGFLYNAYLEPLNEKGQEKLLLYSMKPDGSNGSKVAEIDRVIYYAFGGEYFYYGLGKESGQNEGGLYRMNLDGTNIKKVNTVEIWSLDGVAGDWMYISDYGGPRFRVKLDGTLGVRIE